jgi:nicotinate-nucleotide pyrophosphorylase (carboxylating)
MNEFVPLQRMSGIASATREMVDACAGTPTQILETRKTVPGLRVLDKWAVLIGGGQNHRMGLYDMIMIKDNHIAAAGGLREAVEQAKAWVREREKRGVKRIEIEVETRTMEEVAEVSRCLDEDSEGLVTRVMLDNMVRRNKACDGAHSSPLA